MSIRDKTREKMSRDLLRSPEFSHFQGAASGICFALHSACLGGGVVARPLMLAFESRGSVVCRQARAG
jgi:hypothetical protein